MQTHLINDQIALQETDTFEFLSSFIQLFRRSVALAELLAVLLQKEQDCSPVIEKIRLLFEQFQPLKARCDSLSEPDCVNQVTFHRFTCRLLEIIYLTAAKYKEYNQAAAYRSLILCLKEIQTAVKQHEEARMLFEIIKIIQLSFIKFCINCRKGVKCLDEESEKKYQESFAQLRQVVVKTVRSDKKQLSKKGSLEEQLQQFQSDESESEEKAAMQATSNISLNKVQGLSKQLTEIQRRFQVFKGLDLDFSSFRSNFFLAKGNKQNAFQECLKRNDLNRKLITTYQDDFYLFQKKKSNKQNKRNKLKNMLQGRDLTHSQISKLNTLREMANQSLEERRILNRSRGIDQDGAATPHGYQERDLSPTLESKSVALEANSKKQLKMKNVQLFLGKGKGAKYMKVTHNAIKNTCKIQPMCISQSYYNQLQSQSQQSLEFIHTRLRIENCKSRNKTELERNQKKGSQDHSWMVGQQGIKKNTDPLPVKSKPNFKGKYLQINCVGRNQQVQLKRRLFHNGASITKIGLRTGFKLDNNRVAIKLG